MCIYFWETETEHKWERNRERGRHRFRSRLQVLSCQHRVRCGARTRKLWDHDLSRSQTLNWLSHPGTPSKILFWLWHSMIHNIMICLMILYFLDNLLFSCLPYFKNTEHNMYNTKYVFIICLCTSKVSVHVRLLVVTFLGNQWLYKDFKLCGSLAPLQPLHFLRVNCICRIWLHTVHRHFEVCS